MPHPRRVVRNRPNVILALPDPNTPRPQCSTASPSASGQRTCEHAIRDTPAPRRLLLSDTAVFTHHDHIGLLDRGSIASNDLRLIQPRIRCRPVLDINSPWLQTSRVAVHAHFVRVNSAMIIGSTDEEPLIGVYGPNRDPFAFAALFASTSGADRANVCAGGSRMETGAQIIEHDGKPITLDKLIDAYLKDYEVREFRSINTALGASSIYAPSSEARGIQVVSPPRCA